MSIAGRASVVLALAALVGGAAPVRGASAAGEWPWVLPLARDLVVRRGFHPPPQPWLAGHRGVDLAGRPGEAVRAVGRGRVSFAGVLAGRGVVTVVHGALRTTYEPVDAQVSEGDVVAAGQAVGLLLPGHGSPRPGEALLHWGLLRGRAYLDPLVLVRRAPPRLLPHWDAGPLGNWRPAGAVVARRPDRGSAAADRAGVVATSERSRPARPAAGGAVVTGMAAVAATAALRRRRR